MLNDTAAERQDYNSLNSALPYSKAHILLFKKYFFPIKIQYILSAEKLNKIKELDGKTKQNKTKYHPLPYHPKDTTGNIGYFISSLLF